MENKKAKSRKRKRQSFNDPQVCPQAMKLGNETFHASRIILVNHFQYFKTRLCDCADFEGVSINDPLEIPLECTKNLKLAFASLMLFLHDERELDLDILRDILVVCDLLLATPKTFDAVYRFANEANHRDYIYGKPRPLLRLMDSNVRSKLSWISNWVFTFFERLDLIATNLQESELKDVITLFWILEKKLEPNAMKGKKISLEKLSKLVQRVTPELLDYTMGLFENKLDKHIANVFSKNLSYQCIIHCYTKYGILSYRPKMISGELWNNLDKFWERVKELQDRKRQQKFLNFLFMLSVLSENFAIADEAYEFGANVNAIFTYFEAGNQIKKKTTICFICENEKYSMKSLKYILKNPDIEPYLCDPLLALIYSSRKEKFREMLKLILPLCAPISDYHNFMPAIHHLFQHHDLDTLKIFEPYLTKIFANANMIGGPMMNILFKFCKSNTPNDTLEKITYFRKHRATYALPFVIYGQGGDTIMNLYTVLKKLKQPDQQNRAQQIRNILKFSDS